MVNHDFLTKTDVEKVFNGTFDLFKNELAKGNNVAITGFGTFKVSERSVKEGRNLSTGATIQIPASKSVSFKVGINLKESVNK